MEKIIIIGASDQSRHTIDIIEKELKYQIVGVLDKKLAPGQVFEGYDILGYIPEIASLFSEKKISATELLRRYLGRSKQKAKES